MCDDGCIYRFSNFIVYMVLFYGLYFAILQYTWFFVGCSLNWNVAFVTFYLTVYMVLFYGLVLEILQYTRFNWKFTVLCKNFTV